MYPANLLYMVLILKTPYKGCIKFEFSSGGMDGGTIWSKWLIRRGLLFYRLSKRVFSF